MGEYRQELMTLMKRDDLGNKRKNDSSVTNSNIHIKSLHGIKVCVDCAAPNPQWATIPYAVFICLSVRDQLASTGVSLLNQVQCAGLHRGLGVHISFGELHLCSLTILV